MRLTAGILAGGQSRRMGRDKAFLDAGGVPLIDYLISRLTPICSEVLVATRSPSQFSRLTSRVVVDELSTPSPLAGIHAVLKAAREPAAFVCAVDLPYLNEKLIEHLFANLEIFDAVLPEGEAGVEPLCAIYTRACLPPIESAAAQGRLKITDAISGCNVRVLAVRDADWLVRGASPFTNINLPEEYERFRQKMF